MREPSRGDDQDVPELKDTASTFFDKALLSHHCVPTSQQFYFQPTWFAVCGKHFIHLK